MFNLIQAHRKVLLASLTALLIQYVDSETADWIVTGVGIALTYFVPNDQDAIESVYGPKV